MGLQPLDIRRWPLPLSLLLQAACLKGPHGRQAWQAWRQQADLDELEPGAFSLLPLLYHNLRELDISDPWMPRLKGIYLRNWYKNQVLLQRAAGLLYRFHEVGIEACAVKGTALALLGGEDFGRHSLTAFEVLAPAEQAPAAMRLLQQLDWTPTTRLPEPLVERYVSVGHVHRFSNSAEHELALHWHVLSHCPVDEADAEFLKDAAPVSVHGAPARALSGASLLLDLCADGGAPGPLRVAQVWLALQAAGAALDWARVLAQAERWRLTVPLQETLEAVQACLAGPLPLEWMQRVRALRPARREWIERRLRRHQVGWLRRLAAHWFNYACRAGGAGGLRRLLGFPIYLQHLWRLERLWQVPGYAVSSRARVRAGRR